jgi:RHS repeat-associated protein
VWNADVLAREEVWRGEERVSERFWSFLDDEPIARVDRTRDGERAVYYHNDHLGAPQVCTGEDGEVVWQSHADSYGFDSHEGSLEQPIALPGQYRDEETGLCYNRYRYYDPHSGRYLTPDPLEVDLERNAYTYPRDPLTMADPLGLTKTVVLFSGASDLKPQSVNLGKGFGARVKSIKGLFGPSLKGVQRVVLFGHGNAQAQAIRVRSFWDRLLGRKGTLMNGQQLGECLKKKGFKGTEVVVVSCQMAKGFGQSLANELGGSTTVEAWPNNTVVDSAGNVRMRQNPGITPAQYGAPGDGSTIFTANSSP